jgi:hypothetical protein
LERDAKLMWWGFSREKSKRFVNPHELRWSRRAELPSKREPEIDRGSRNRSYMGHSQVTQSTQALCHSSIYYIFICITVCKRTNKCSRK